MSTKKNSDQRAEIEFRGGCYEVSITAARSMRVQKAMALASEPGHQMDAYEAFDAICCGRSDEYMARMPEEDGEVSEYGASADAFAAFMGAVGDAMGKNSQASSATG